MKNHEIDILNKIIELIRYYDLGFILNHIEEIIQLPAPYKNSSMTQEQFSNNTKLASEYMNNIQSVSDIFLDECNLRKETFINIRKTYPTFCTQLGKKLSNEEYEEYLFLLKGCSKNISKLVQSFKDRKNDYNELIMNKKDFISSIIDSESTSRLTFIQDSFVLNELNSIDCSSMDSKTRANIRIIEKDLNTRIANYHEFQHMHSTKKVIKIKSDNTEKEER